MIRDLSDVLSPRTRCAAGSHFAFWLFFCFVLLGQKRSDVPEVRQLQKPSLVHVFRDAAAETGKLRAHPELVTDSGCP